MAASDATVRRDSAARWLAGPTWIAGAILLLADVGTLLALFGSRWWWPFEVIAHFTVQFAALQLACLLCFGVRRRLGPIVVTVPVLLANVFVLAPYYLPTRAGAADSSPAMLRVMTLNLYGRNDRIDLVERVVAQEAPDVILFVEATQRWYEQLADIRKRYPYVIHYIVRNRYATILASRIALREARILTLGDQPLAVAFARICPDDSPDRCLLILGGHAARPQSAEASAARDDQLLSMARLAAQSGNGRTAMMGDFNITPYSPVFSRVLRTGNLRDSALGFPPRTTWLSRFPLFGLPIDHIFVGEGVRVMSRHVGDAVGSDHFPVIADLAY